VADAAEDVIAIADHFGLGRFSVVGRSGGAPHALACAALKKDRVICAAALGSLAPYDAEGLNWSEGMADSNVRAYRNAGLNVPALIATLNDQAGQVRRKSESLLELLWPELVGDDKRVVGNIAIRRIIAETHAKALRETADGWIDDVIALSRPWDFKPSEITIPVMLWHGGNDVFSPVRHTYWLKGQIKTAELDVEPEAAHFGTVESLPKILTWIAGTVDAQMQAAPRVTALPSTGRAR
jgi:pimeloyl-ACP methyl ester carboxylesterase